MSELFKCILFMSNSAFNRELDLLMMFTCLKFIVTMCKMLNFYISFEIMWDLQRSIYRRVSHDLENRCVAMRGSEIILNFNMYDWIVILMMSYGSRGPHLQPPKIYFKWEIIHQFGIYMVSMIDYARKWELGLLVSDMRSDTLLWELSIRSFLY